MRLLSAFSCLLIVLLAACTGGSDGDNGDNPTPEATATRSASSTPSRAARDTPSTDETPGAPTPDPFAGLRSYRYEIRLFGGGAAGVIVKGAVEAPDSLSLDFYLSDSDTPLNSIIIIDDEAWSKSSLTGDWDEIDVAEARDQVSGLLAADFWGDFPTENLLPVSVNEGEETVNGVEATHYQISEVSGDALLRLAKIFGDGESDVPESFSMDLWLAVDGGWPARATISATFPVGSEITQASIEWQVSDVNSDAVSIEPPV